MTAFKQQAAGVTAGVGTYVMHYMKDFNQLNMPGFPGKQVTNFPPYPYYRANATFSWELLSAGLDYTFQSTGSRISSKDYSGEYRFDVMVKSNNIGFDIARKLLWKNKQSLAVGMRGGVAFTQGEIHQYLRLMDSTYIDQTTKMTSVNPYIEPGLRFNYMMLPYLNISLQAGYYMHIGERPFQIEDHDLEIGPEWSGIRIGITLNYVFGHRNGE